MNARLLHLLKQRIDGDCTLQARLFELTDPKDFSSAVRALAEESGYALEEADVLEAIQTGRRAWSGRNKQ